MSDRPEPQLDPGAPRGVAAFLWGAPALLALLVVLWPVVVGAESFVLRDVLDVHVLLSVPQAAALEAGELLVVDPHRGGGLPAVGNPNAVPLYPTRLAHLALPFFAVFHLHFWLHLLLAVPAMAWLGREWGLARPAAWVAGVAYALSGFAFSHLNFFNLVASLPLVPAFAAAVLALVVAGGLWRAAAVGGLWALLLLSGDPLMAALALVVAGGATLARCWGSWHGDGPGSGGRRRLALRLGLLGLGLALGMLAALPQLVEFLRILPESFRGHWRHTAVERATAGAWHPAGALEWLIPQVFGRLDLLYAGRYWSFGLTGGRPPLYLSFAPGLIVLALVLVSGLPRDRRAVWAWGSIACGLFFAAGVHNPLVPLVLELPGLGAFRYPAKLWTLVALPASVLAGIGFERVFGRRPGAEAPERRRLAVALGLLGGAVLVFVAAVHLAPGWVEARVIALAEGSSTPELAAIERSRWTATAVVSMATVLAALGLLGLARRRARAASVLLVALHVASQLFFLRPLLASVPVTALLEPPPLLEALRQSAPGGDLSAIRLVHGDHLGLFGRPPVDRGEGLPAPRYAEIARRGQRELVPWTGVLHGLRYEMTITPEGLDPFLASVARDLVEQARDDRERVRSLAAWGVTHLVLSRPLHAVPEELAREVARLDGLGRPIHLYELPGATPELFFAERAVPTPHVGAAWSLFVSPGFDPHRMATLPGPPDGPEPDLADLGTALGTEAPAGRVRLLAAGPESIEAEVESPVPGLLVTRRSYLPLWRAEIDGREVTPEPANIYRLAVPVPAGRHRVRLWVDQGLLRRSGAGALVGMVGLVGLLGVGLRRRGRGERTPGSG